MLPEKYNDPEIDTLQAILLRELNVLLVSLIIGFLLVSVLRKFLRHSSLGVNLVVKTAILVAAGIAMNFFIYVPYQLIIEDHTLSAPLRISGITHSGQDG